MDTNPGVLLLGTLADRARVRAAAVVQAINCDERDDKIADRFWDDHGDSHRGGWCHLARGARVPAESASASGSWTGSVTFWTRMCLQARGAAVFFRAKGGSVADLDLGSCLGWTRVRGLRG